MTDKIKVWKCEGCSNSGRTAFCIFTDFSNNTKSVKNCPHGLYDNPPWQPTTDYEITERKPEIDTRPTWFQAEEAAKKATELTERMPAQDHTHIGLGNLGYDTPPRRRVKIIWSDITGPSQVEAAHQILQKMGDGDILTQEIIDSLPSDFADYFPDRWLEDIDDGPVSAKEYSDSVKLLSASGSYRYTYSQLKDAFIAGETNERKRYLPTMSFDEWEENPETILDDDDSLYSAAEKGWNARGISNNLPPEQK